MSNLVSIMNMSSEHLLAEYLERVEKSRQQAVLDAGYVGSPQELMTLIESSWEGLYEVSDRFQEEYWDWLDDEPKEKELVMLLYQRTCVSHDLLVKHQNKYVTPPATLRIKIAERMSIRQQVISWLFSINNDQVGG